MTDNKFGKYNGNELSYLERALDTENQENKNFPWVRTFEDEFVKLTGAKYAIALNSATSGLHAALAACNLSLGDEVISPGLSVVMNATMTVQLGLNPVFADINKDTLNIDIDTILPLVTEKTKVIMPVALFGVPVDMDPIMEFAREKNITVIDDSAETICGTYKNKFAGTHADIAVYSFETKKHMTSGGEGGMAITSDEQLATNMRKYSGIGYKNLTASAGRTSLAAAEFQNPEYERHDVIGLNYRMNSITAAVGLAQLERINFLVERRIKVGELFKDAVDNCSWMIPQASLIDSNHTYYTFAVKYYGQEEKNISWKEFYSKYKEKGGDGFYGAWVNPHLEPVLKNKKYGEIECKEGLCPVAEDLQSRLMLFKTNYRDLSKAEKNANLLRDLIEEINKN